MTNRQIKKFSESTVYDVEKNKKMENFTYLNKVFCKEGQVVLAGDSITELFNMELFDAWRECNNTVVYNRGISGDTSNRLLERFKDNVLSIKPKTVVLLIGINDLSKKASCEYIAGNIEKMLELIKQEPYDIHVILQAVYPVNTPMHMNLRRRKIGPTIISKLNSNLRQLAKKYDADYLDLTKLLSNEKGYLKNEFTYDGLHPNAKGFTVVAEQLTKLLP